MRDLALQARGRRWPFFVAIRTWGDCRAERIRQVAYRAERTQTLLRMVWQASTVDGSALASCLIAAPALRLGSCTSMDHCGGDRRVGYGAIGNAVASRGRHVGWCLMGCVVALALLGL